MFEFIRSHQRLMQLVLTLLILPSFAFWGVQSYSSFRQSETGIANVGGQPVTQQEFDAAQRSQLQRLQQMLGPNFDPALVETPAARTRILNGLIDERVLLNDMVRHHLAVSDQRVSEELRANPALKSVYRADGTVDVERYDQLLASVGMTREQVFAETRRDLLYRQEGSTIPDTAMIPKAVAVRLDQLLDQQREIQVQLFNPADFLNKVQLGQDELKKYYDANGGEFETPEQAKIAYVILDLKALAARVSLKPEEAKAFYDQNHARYAVPEERRASHILIAVAKDAPAAARQQAKAKAESLLAQLKIHPTDFAKLAKENSSDPGSAEKGGDLGWASVSSYVQPFADALFKLPDGALSGVVETDYGYHIILCTGIHAAMEKPFETVRGDIESELRTQQAKRQFSEAAESFTNIVYEQPDSLDPAAAKLGLTVLTADAVTRALAPGGDATSPLNSAKLHTAVFSDDVLKNKHNTEAIEVGPSTLVSARILEYRPAKRQPLSDVEGVIRQKVMTADAQRLALAAGEARLDALHENAADVSAFATPITISRASHGDVPLDAVNHVFALPAAGIPGFVGVSLPNGAYALYRVIRVVPAASETAAADDARAQQLLRHAGELDYSSYLESLKNRLKVTISKGFEAPAVATANKP